MHVNVKYTSNFGERIGLDEIKMLLIFKASLMIESYKKKKKNHTKKHAQSNNNQEQTRQILVL